MTPKVAGTSLETSIGGVGGVGTLPTTLLPKVFTWVEMADMVWLVAVC